MRIALTLAEKLTYMTVPEIHAAVHAVADIADRYFDHRAKSGIRASREELFENLIAFFAGFDRLRTEEIESLRAQLVDALQLSVKPPVGKFKS